MFRLRSSVTRDTKTQQIRQKGHDVRLQEKVKKTVEFMHHEVLQNDYTVNSNIYCQQIERTVNRELIKNGVDSTKTRGENSCIGS